jgi:hypothetical protein
VERWLSTASPQDALTILQQLATPALRQLIRAYEFHKNFVAKPWPTSIAAMISEGWRYPNGENFTTDAWARLAAHDLGTRSLFLVSGAVGDALWAPFFAAEAERLGVTVAALKEEHVAHVGDRFVKTGQGACATFFGMHKRQPLVRCATSLEITDLGSLATNPASNHDSPPPPLSPTACGQVIYMYVRHFFSTCFHRLHYTHEGMKP